MQHSIANSQLQVSILNQGAEICSLKSIQSGKEYIWQADPKIWGSNAPVLFPAIGSFKGGFCTINNRRYHIPKHGFIRHNKDIQLLEKTTTSLLYELKYSEKTLALFPYQFNFQIRFEILDNQLKVIHQVENLDDTEIHFALGAHPAFNCPLHENEQYSDYYLQFEKIENAERTLLSADGLITNQTTPVLENVDQLNLHPTLFNDDALIFKKLKSRKVQLKSRKSNQVLTLSYADFDYLGIWAKPNAPFICIEPWLGIADHENTNGDFLQKEGLICLSKGKTFTASYEITIEEL